MKKKVFLGAIFISAVFLGVYLTNHSFFLVKPLPAPSSIVSTTTTIISINGKTYILEIADTALERQQGLSNRQALPQEHGLLFVFEDEGQYGFWMKDMNFPIDIIWLDKNKKIVFIKENVVPESYPQSYSNKVPALYVLETNVGFVKEHNLKIGDIMNIK
ncbi:MAG: DUF192 domain-containing protein [bacterium]|nr:DUF192 domain-containing protein [bacterium]